MNMSAPEVDRVATLPSAYRLEPARNPEPPDSSGMEWNPADDPDGSLIRGESRFLLCDSSCSDQDHFTLAPSCDGTLYREDSRQSGSFFTKADHPVFGKLF